MSQTNINLSAETGDPQTGGLLPTPAIDASCRLPVLALLSFGTLWLLVSGLLWLASAIQLAAPGFLEGCPWVTVGHLQPAAWNVLLYGFVIQAGLGVMLWMLARLGNAELRNAPLVIFAGLIWNAGVLLGLVGILHGDNTGFSWLEFPRYASALLFSSYALIMVAAVLNFSQRRRTGLYVSQWYLLAALFWFPWIFSTAVMLLSFRPVRGVVQVVVDGWFKAALGQVWIGGVGIAVIFYLLPKLLNRPLHSRALASLGFWTSLFFAGWTAVSPAAPVPAWIASASTVGALLLLVPTLAFTLNVACTSCGALEKGLPRSEVLFALFASACYIAANILSAWGSKRGVAEVVRLTFFGNAHQVCLVYGVGVMSLMAAIAFLVPKLLGLEDGAFRLLGLQFWISAVGVVLLVFVFTFGGLQLGRAINTPALGYADVSAMDHSILAAGVLGVALVFAGQIVLALQLFGLIGQGARESFCNFAAEVTKVGGKPAGAKV